MLRIFYVYIVLTIIFPSIILIVFWESVEGIFFVPTYTFTQLLFTLLYLILAIISVGLALLFAFHTNINVRLNSMQRRIIYFFIFTSPIIIQFFILLYLLNQGVEFRSIRHSGLVILGSSLAMKVYFGLSFITRPAYYMIFIALLLKRIKFEPNIAFISFLFLLISLLSISSMRSFFDIAISSYLLICYLFKFQIKINFIYAGLSLFFVLIGGFLYKSVELFQSIPIIFAFDYLKIVLIERTGLNIMSFLNAISFMVNDESAVHEVLRGTLGVSLHKIQCLFTSCAPRDFATLSRLNYEIVSPVSHLLPIAGASQGLFATAVYTFPFGILLFYINFLIICWVCDHKKTSYINSFIILFCFATTFKDPIEFLIIPSEGFLMLFVVLLLNLTIKSMERDEKNSFY
jgi:hypothetical protein